jgi:asparagine synthase (glutamine-hydrolysing)
MMHRFVVAISTADGSHEFHQVKLLLDERFKSWSMALDQSRARAWVFQQTPSQMSHRQLGVNGCLIGVDFEYKSTIDALQHCGSEGVADILRGRWGAYVAVLADPRTGIVNVYRDPSGRIECWRMSLDGVDILFSHLDDVSCVRPRGATINWDYLLYHLSSPSVQNEETGLSGVTEVLPGQELRYAGGLPERRMRWSPEKIASAPFTEIGEAQAALRDAAELATQSLAERYDTIALDLSGGLDSTTVLGLLRRHARHPNVVGFNYVTSHAESDERAYAREAAQYHSIRLVELLMMPGDRIDPDNSFARRLLRPDPRMLASVYDELTTSAYAGISAKAYFTGTAGDHLFGEVVNVNAVCDYTRYHGFDGGAVAAAHQLAQASKKHTIWSAARAVLADQFQPYRSVRAYLETPNEFLSEEAHESIDFDRFAHPWIRSGVRTLPPAKLRQVFGLAELQRHYSRYGRADVAEEVHPLFSQPLMEAALRTPSYWFADGGMRRGLMRRTFADLLPTSIRERRTKGANTSLWLAVMGRDLRRISELLLDGQLAKRKLIDRGRIEQALKDLASIGARKPQRALKYCLTTEMWVEQMDLAGAPSVTSRASPAPVAFASAPNADTAL